MHCIWKKKKKKKKKKKEEVLDNTHEKVIYCAGQDIVMP
jgi:hypothetical protein